MTEPYIFLALLFTTLVVLVARRLLNRKKSYTGSGIFTVPDGVKYLEVQMVGGGGGGSDSDNLGEKHPDSCDAPFILPTGTYNYSVEAVNEPNNGDKGISESPSEEFCPVDVPLTKKPSKKKSKKKASKKKSKKKPNKRRK